MAEQLADLSQGGALAQRLCGGEVPQPVSADHREAGPSARGANNVGHSVARQPCRGRMHSQEQPPALDALPASAQVAGHRLADVVWQRQELLPITFSPHHHLASPPVEVVEAERGRLADA